MSYYGRGDGGEYRHNGYDQQANNRERSRSRDHNDRLFGGGGGGRGGDHYGGGGYGGRNGGRNGGGGGGRGWNGDRGGRGGGGGHRAPRPTNLEVSLNYFPIKVIDSDLMEWVMYDIHVLNMKRVKKKDAEGNFIEPWEFDFVPNQKGATNMDKFPEVLLRRILDALRKQNNFILVTDGKAICYTNKRLFSKEESTSANPGSHEEASGLSAVGRYGPADTGGHNMPIGPSDIYNDYYVRTKRNVDENDPDADKSKNAWYRVRLKEVAAIPFSEVKKALTGMQQESEYLHKVKQATEIIMKSGMFAVMNSFGKSPRKFYFPEDVQDQIMGEFRNQSSTRGIQDLLRDFSSRNPLVPYIGIESRLKPCTGNMFVNTDTCLDYFYREHYRTRGPHQNDNKEPVPVLHEENRSIAGVRIPNVHGRIPEHLQPEVKQAIKKLRFHVTYYRKKNSEAWLQRKREQGWDDKKIKRANRNVRKNCTMKLDDDKKGIIWSADDPNEHSFEMNVTRPTEDNPNPDKVTQTIESYYREKYGILLKYPKMPCVYIGKGEWYPIEFLFQAQERASHPHLNEMKLKYYDEIAGFHRSVHIRKSYQKLAGLLQNDPNHDLLRQFGIMRIDEPITLRAKVLPEPKLSFANQEAHINDGKWNLMNKKFKRPADLPSFAFINMTHDKSNKYMSGLFESMEKHGIILPQNVDCRYALEHVTCNMKVTRSPDPEHVYDAFIEAIGRAKSFFLYDKQGAFRKNNVWFKTRFLKDGNWEECLVIPPPEHIDTDTVGIMLRGGPTHMLGDTPVRIMAGCVDMGGNQKVVDPFNLRFKPHRANNGPPHQMFENNKWEQCRFVKYFYQTQDGKIIDDDPDNAMPYTFVEPGHNIEMVAMVFVFLPSDDSQTYNTVKLMSQFEFGIPSQCCVIEKFNKQKGKGEQFLSNIALKLNAKLMNSDNKAFAWVTSPNNAVPGQRSHGIPWINEIPTLVIGISLSHGLGEESITVVGASVGLDPCLMQFAQLCRVQKKSEKGQHDTVSEGTMMYLTQTLFLHFLLHNGVYPQRVLIYRNGASDGEFDTIRDREVIAMRKGLRKIIQQQKGDEFNCPLSCQSGCLHCTPPITYVVCQTQHSIVVVPKDQNLAPRANQNVPSGTCVDEKTIMDYRDGQLMATRDIDRNKPSNSSMELFENVEEYGYDFILTSHGGLKGTSKPVYYRVVLNENAVWRPMSDCSPLTKNMLQVCTYHQSFQYGTATKTVRAVPVVHYSQRIANQFMGYVNQIRPNKRQDLRRWDTDGCPLIEIKTENMDESDPSLDQEEKSSGRVYYIHKKMNGPDKKALPECMREEIQFASSPFEPEDDFETNGLRLRPPLRPHISA